jgi:ketosteroid isomerase-like protein
MRTSYSSIKLILVCFFILSGYKSVFAQTNPPNRIDIKKAKIIVDSLDKQFSKYYFNGDSVALAAMYTKDASFGALRGKDILLAFGKMIRNSIQNNTRNITYTTTSLGIDGEFIIEVGKYEMKDDSGNSKAKGKYLVVWKQENGAWKLYRDVGL